MLRHDDFTPVLKSPTIAISKDVSLKNDLEIISWEIKEDSTLV